MFNLSWNKPLKVGKRDTYTIDVVSWSGGEDVLAVTSSMANGLATLVAHTLSENISGKMSIVGVTLIGAEEGIETVTLNYSTATRTDSVEVTLKVGETCLTQ